MVKFSGTVTVDGQPPAVDRRNPLFVIAYDPKNPPKGRQLPFTARCDKDGHFQFNTYSTGDGLPAGSYVVLFVQPKTEGGDALKNLYNDPDKNAQRGAVSNQPDSAGQNRLVVRAGRRRQRPRHHARRTFRDGRPGQEKAGLNYRQHFG